MNSNTDKIIGQIESRLQFVITLNTLLLTLIYGLGRFAGQTEELSQKNMIGGGIMIVGYLLAYVIFEVRKEKIRGYGLKLINGVVLVGIACFIFPIMVISLSAAPSATLVPQWQAFFYVVSFVISTYGLLVIPVLTVLLSLFWPKYKDTD